MRGAPKVGPRFYNNLNYQKMAIPFIALLPSIMSALGMGASHFSNRNAINRQNRYNDPAMQVQRLREAGLPLTALDGTAQAGNQSQAQPSPNYEEGGRELGNNIREFLMTAQQKKQMQLIDEQINTQKAVTMKEWALALEADVNAKRNNELLQDQLRTDIPDNTKLYPHTQGGPNTNMAQDLVRARRLQEMEISAREANVWVNKNEALLKGLEYSIRKDLYDKGLITAETEARIRQMMANAGLTEQQIRQNGLMDILINKMSEDGISAGDAMKWILLNKLR